MIKKVDSFSIGSFVDNGDGRSWSLDQVVLKRRAAKTTKNPLSHNRDRQSASDSGAKEKKTRVTTRMRRTGNDVMPDVDYDEEEKMREVKGRSGVEKGEEVEEEETVDGEGGVSLRQGRAKRECECEWTSRKR